MSARNKDGKDRQHKHLDDPAAPEPASSEDQIEIVEVLGVDEATGTAATPDPPPHRSAEPDPPASHGERRSHIKRLLEEALRDKEKYYDLLLRKQAEFDNFRKRGERDREEFRQQATVEMIRELLPVLDNLDRALATREGGETSIREGVGLIRQQILDVLKKAGVAPLEALGQVFDPRVHEAVDVQDVPGCEKGVVLEEVRRGYALNDRLLRPAMVKVASGGAPAAAGGRREGADDDGRGGDR
jgi:molecular chaperone GrpE